MHVNPAVTARRIRGPACRFLSLAALSQNFPAIATLGRDRLAKRCNHGRRATGTGRIKRGRITLPKARSFKILFININILYGFFVGAVRLLKMYDQRQTLATIQRAYSVIPPRCFGAGKRHPPKRLFETSIENPSEGHTMTLFAALKNFHNDESGAVTVDWVVLTAAIVGLGIAVLASVGGGVKSLSTKISSQLSAQTIATY